MYGSKNYSLMDGEDSAGFQAKDYGTLSGKTTTKGAGMDPATAGLVVGGGFLGNLMEAKAREEEAKKQAALQAVQTQLEGQTTGNNTLMQAWAKALGGMK